MNESRFFGRYECYCAEDLVFVCRAAVISFVLFDVMLNIDSRFVNDSFDYGKIGGIQLHMFYDAQGVDAGASLDARGLLACQHFTVNG